MLNFKGAYNIVKVEKVIKNKIRHSAKNLKTTIFMSENFFFMGENYDFHE